MADRTISTVETSGDQGATLNARRQKGGSRSAENAVIAGQTPSELPPDAATDTHVVWDENLQARVSIDKSGKRTILPREKPL